MTKQDIFTDSDHRKLPHYYAQPDDEIDLRELFGALWRGKLIILITTILFAAGAVAYALHLPNIYKSDALLAPADGSRSGLSQMASQFGGLASLAGINMTGTQVNQTNLAIKVLKSRDFIKHFIHKHDLLASIMATKGWSLESNTLIYNDKVFDIKSNKWLRKPNGLRSSPPSSQEVYKVFTENILKISQDENSGLYTLSISFYSPYLAQQWVTWLVQDINNVMRNRTIAETTQNLNYLQAQLKKTAVADMQSTFYKLIEEQTKKQMLAEVQEEFVFKVVDPAIVPETRDNPNRKVIAVLGTFLGSIFGMCIILVRFYIQGGGSSNLT